MKMTKPDQQIRLVRLIRTIPSIVLDAVEAGNGIVSFVQPQVSMRKPLANRYGHSAKRQKQQQIEPPSTSYEWRLPVRQDSPLPKVNCLSADFARLPALFLPRPFPSSLTAPRRRRLNGVLSTIVL